MGRSLYIVLAASAAVALATIAWGAAPAPVNSCSALVSDSSLHALPNTTIDSAATVVGTFTPPRGKPIAGLPSFCRMTATVKPTPASDIKVEVWMPTEGWNGKLEGVGDHGLAGLISYTSPAGDVDHASLVDAIKSGYAGVSTDAGHAVPDTTWLPNAEKERDFGYRAIHEMTVIAKAAVQSFYGDSAKHSYFNGNGTGGGQALGEAQLYPEDYDGILAGGPQNFLTHSLAMDLYQYQALTNSDPALKVSKDTLAMVTRAVLKRCGKDSGADVDGYLATDPRSCNFAPEELLCHAGDDPANCLNPAQVKFVSKIYAEFTIPGTHELVMPGLPRGSEGPAGPGDVGWTGRPYMSGEPLGAVTAVQFYSLGVLQDPNADLRKIDLGSAVQMADQKFPFLNHTSVDLEAFSQRGGKLIIYHGWDDQNNTALDSIDYFSSLVDALQRKRHLNDTAALAEAEKSVRLFVVPGMGHSGGGPGPNSFEALQIIDQWVAHGEAPDKIVIPHVTETGAKTFSRPLCAYPLVAGYKGSGDRADSSNWACVKGTWAFSRYDRSFYGSPPKPK